MWRPSVINQFTWGLNWFKKLQFDVNVFAGSLLVPSTSNLAIGLHNKKKQPEKKQSCDQTPSSSPSSSLSDCIDQNSNPTSSLGPSLEDKTNHATGDRKSREEGKKMKRKNNLPLLLDKGHLFII